MIIFHNRCIGYSFDLIIDMLFSKVFFYFSVTVFSNNAFHVELFHNVIFQLSLPLKGPVSVRELK